MCIRDSFMLGAQYRNPINFSDELMESAKNGLDRIKDVYKRQALHLVVPVRKKVRDILHSATTY